MNKMGQNYSITERLITEKEEPENQRREYIKEAEQDKGVRKELDSVTYLEAMPSGVVSGHENK